MADSEDLDLTVYKRKRKLSSAEKSKRQRLHVEDIEDNIDDDKRNTGPHWHADDNPNRLDDYDHNVKSLNYLDRNTVYSKNNTYHKGGLAHSLHGVIYQLKVLMLYFKHAWDFGYDFNLGTEVEDAEKFDDIVLRYRKKDCSGIHFVQVKHKQDESKKITTNDLLNATNDDFSLQKYFISYRNINKNPKFSDCNIKCFIIFTNIGIADLGDIEVKTLTNNNDILDVTSTSDATKRCKLIVPKDHELYQKLRETSDVHCLVNELKEHMLENKTLKLTSIIFKRYYVELGKKIFNISAKNKAKFRKDFINGNYLSEDVNNIRELLQVALKIEDAQEFENKLSQIELNVSASFRKMSDTPEKNLTSVENKLPNDKIEDTEIQEFFDSIIFAVNQPNVDGLDEIIAEKMGQSSLFNLLDASLVSNFFANKMLNWFKERRQEKGKEGVWLNADNGQMFMDSIEQQVSSLISVGINVAYLEKLAKHGMRFCESKVIRKIKKFLRLDSLKGVSKKILHIIVREKTILSAIHVYSALEDLKRQEEFTQLNSCDSYNFIRLSTLLENKTQTYIIKAFQSDESHNLLIIDCESADQLNNAQVAFYNDLMNTLQKPNKRIIFIAKEQNKLINLFTNDLKCTVEGDSKFDDLTEKSKEKLLEKEVIFQGEKVSFKQLIDKNANEIINESVIEKLLRDEEISINNKDKDLGDINDYYVDRRLTQITFSKEKIEQYIEEGRSESIIRDLFLISGTNVSIEKRHNILVFKDDESAEIFFNRFSNLEKATFNVHWIKADSKKLIWYKSHGSVSNLVHYRIGEKNYNTYEEPRPSCMMGEMDLVCENRFGKFVIICDTAGMGKSTLLTHLSMEIKRKTTSNRWVTRINLNDHTDVLYRILKSKNLKFCDRNIDEVFEFLSNDLLNSQELSMLEKKLFENRFHNSGKITLLFDGFDEISPDYYGIVLDLLQSLKKSKVEQIIVTTRPNYRDELEQALEVFSYGLGPLLRKEQIDFLIRFWKKKLVLWKSEDINRLKIYAQSIIKFISDSIKDKEQDFIGVPLQTMMIAEVFLKNQEIPDGISAWQSCSEFLKSELKEPKLPTAFDLINLYEFFVKTKFCKFHLEEKKGRKFSKVGEREQADDEYEKYKKNHAILSLQALFNENELQELLTQEEIQKLETLKEKLKNGNHNEGVIDEIVNDKPHFIHRTLAEYFASFLIAEKILASPAETLQSIDNKLLNMSPIFINNIVKQLGAKQDEITSVLKKPLLLFVNVEIHSNLIKSLLKSDYNDWPKKLDTFGKTPLIYAIEHGNYKSVNKLLEYANDIHENDIIIHGKLNNPEYQNSKLVRFINIQDKDGNTALYYALRQHNIDIAFDLLLKGACLDSLADDDITTLTKKMLLISVDTEQRNKYRPIQEKLLLMAPNIFNKLSEFHQSRILSYFFLHGRVKVVESLLGTISSEKRKNLLNIEHNSITPLDLVNSSVDLSDDDRLEITKYIIKNGGTNVTSSISPSDHISQILKAAAQQGHIKTFEYFISQETHENYNYHLATACHHQQIDVIECLLKNHNNIIDINGNTALHVACKSYAQLKIIKHLTECGDVNTLNNKGETPLFMAINVHSKLNLIDYLISKGANVNVENKCGHTPLSLAVEHDREDIIYYLLEKTARVSGQASQLTKKKVAFFKDPNNYDLNVDENGNLRLHTAIKSGDVKWAKFLVRHGADVNQVDTDGNAPLHLEPVLNQVDMVEILLQYGAFFDKKNNDMKTPLDLISELCKRDMHNKIFMLLKLLHKLFSSQILCFVLKELKINRNIYNFCAVLHHMDHPNPWRYNSLLFIINARNSYYQNLLHIAANTNDEQAIFFLFQGNNAYLNLKETLINNFEFQDYQPTSINIKDSQGNTPLHLAAKIGNFQIVSLLLKNGAISHTHNFQGETPEELAAKNKHGKIVKLIQSTKNIFVAIEDKDISKLQVEKFIKEHAFINVKNAFGKTLLHIAASLGQCIVVQLLLDNGANIEAIDLKKNTPLHDAAEKDEKQVVNLLLKRGAVYNTKNSLNQTPLDLANGQSYCILEQVDKMFKIIQSDDHTYFFNDFQVVPKNGIDINIIINIRDNQGNTPLHYAAESCEFNTVKLFLEKGAMFDALNKFRRAPITLTKKKNIVSLLINIDKMFMNIRNIYQVKEEIGMRIITNVRDYAGKKLLDYAVESGNLEIVQLLEKSAIDNNDYLESDMECSP